MNAKRPFPDPLSEPQSYAEQVYAEEHDGPRSVKLFDVTQIIGSVWSLGDRDPIVAAMLIIGESLAEQTTAPHGQFTFPTEDGLSVTVTITTTPQE